jgi:hypothetical protein
LDIFSVGFRFTFFLGIVEEVLVEELEEEEEEVKKKAWQKGQEVTLP